MTLKSLLAFIKSALPRVGGMHLTDLKNHMRARFRVTDAQINSAIALGTASGELSLHFGGTVVSRAAKGGTI